MFRCVFYFIFILLSIAGIHIVSDKKNSCEANYQETLDNLCILKSMEEKPTPAKYVYLVAPLDILENDIPLEFVNKDPLKNAYRFYDLLEYDDNNELREYDSFLSFYKHDRKNCDDNAELPIRYLPIEDRRYVTILARMDDLNPEFSGGRSNFMYARDYEKTVIKPGVVPVEDMLDNIYGRRITLSYVFLAYFIIMIILSVILVQRNIARFERV